MGDCGRQGATMIQRLSYFWGLYPRADAAGPTGARLAADWIAANLPAEGAASFASEGIGELAGTFGDDTLGEPVEVDDLDVDTDSGRVRIRVNNRGIGLMLGMGPELVRLHRFFATIHATAKR